MNTLQKMLGKMNLNTDSDVDSLMNQISGLKIKDNRIIKIRSAKVNSLMDQLSKMNINSASEQKKILKKEVSKFRQNKFNI